MPNPQHATQPHRPFLSRQVPLLIGFALAGVALIAGSIVAFAWLFAQLEPTPITLMVDNTAELIDTRANTVSDLLRERDIALYPNDRVQPALDATIEAAMLVKIDRAHNVTLMVDGQSRLFRTPNTAPAAILQEAGLRVGEDDLLLLDGTEVEAGQLAGWPVPVEHITLRRAVTVHIVDGDTQQTLRTTRQTVGEALYDAGLTLYLADAVSPELNTHITPELEIRITRSQPVTVVADGTTLETRTHAQTVGDALADLGVSLMGLDYSIPGENASLRPGMRVRVIRVTETIISEREELPFGQVEQQDATLELDQIRVLQAGQPGIQLESVRVRYENGIEVSRTPEGVVTVQAPQDRLVTFGTGVVMRDIQTDEAGTLQYWRRVRMLATSYHPAALGGDNITATGQVLTKGIVAADPAVLPYGTQIYVPGYGVGTIADTGGARSTRLWIDLGYDDDNFVPWARWVDVYVLAPVPSEIDYVLPE